MKARDSLIEIMENGGPGPTFSIEEVVDTALTVHAHELAEKIRNELDHHDCICAAANIIDPEVDTREGPHPNTEAE